MELVLTPAHLHKNVNYDICYASKKSCFLDSSQQGTELSSALGAITCSGAISNVCMGITLPNEKKFEGYNMVVKCLPSVNNTLGLIASSINMRGLLRLAWGK